MLMVPNVKAQPCKLTMGLERSYFSLEKVVFPFKGSQKLILLLLLQQKGQITRIRICANLCGATFLQAIIYISCGPRMYTFKSAYCPLGSC